MIRFSRASRREFGLVWIERLFVRLQKIVINQDQDFRNACRVSSIVLKVD